jgi:flagellin-like hook-associated protein FlgL
MLSPGISLGSTTFGLLQNYQINTQFLNQSAKRIASGQQMLSPSDDIVDYFRSEKINEENTQDDSISRGIQEASSFSTLTESVGNSVLSQVQALENMVNQYWDPQTTAGEKSSIATQFSSAIDILDHYIQGTNYQIDDTSSQQVYSDNGGQPFRSVTLDANDPTQTLDISFDANDIVDVNNLRAITLGSTTQANELGLVQAEEAKAGSYVAKASANTISLQSQYNIVQNQMTQNTNFNNVISNTDMASENASYTNMLVTMQMTLAMVAQGNLSQKSVLSLIQQQ